VLTGEETRASFVGEARLQGERFAAKGRGRLQSGDLGPFLMTAAVPGIGFDVVLPVRSCRPNSTIRTACWC
jgi:hypothetical protein